MQYFPRIFFFARLLFGSIWCDSTKLACTCRLFPASAAHPLFDDLDPRIALGLLPGLATVKFADGGPFLDLELELFAFSAGHHAPIPPATPSSVGRRVRMAPAVGRAGRKGNRSVTLLPRSTGFSARSSASRSSPSNFRWPCISARPGIAPAACLSTGCASIRPGSLEAFRILSGSAA